MGPTERKTLYSWEAAQPTGFHVWADSGFQVPFHITHQVPMIQRCMARGQVRINQIRDSSHQCWSPSPERVQGEGGRRNQKTPIALARADRWQQKRNSALAFLGSSQLALTCLLYNASRVPELYRLSVPLALPSSHQKPPHQDNKTPRAPWWKACSFNFQKVPRLPFLPLEREPEATKGKPVPWGVPCKQSKLRASHRPAPDSPVGWSAHHLGTASLWSQAVSKRVMFWFLFFRPTDKQEWHLHFSHQSPPSGIHTPMKQGQKSQDREAGWLPAAHSAKHRKLGKDSRWVFFQEIMERAPYNQPTRKKMDLLGNAFASCCPVTFTQPHRLVLSWLTKP